MPLFSSKLELTSAASGSGVALADVQFIRGAFRTVANTGELNNIPVTQVQDGQIVWVEGASSLYQASVTLADYVNSFADTVSWSTFSGFGSGGGGGASNIGELTDVTTGSLSNGQVLQYNSSTGKWEASSISGTGDISAVFAGDGLTGGGSAGSVSLDVDPGLGMQLTTDGISLDTGSTHFINALSALDTAGIFKATGSYHSTNSNLKVTGSISINFEGIGAALEIKSGSTQLFNFGNDGVFKLLPLSSTPTALIGGVFMDNSGSLWTGVVD
jgi:hypothetical protein